jgi:hypothetical protein
MLGVEKSCLKDDLIPHSMYGMIQKQLFYRCAMMKNLHFLVQYANKRPREGNLA